MFRYMLDYHIIGVESGSIPISGYDFDDAYNNVVVYLNWYSCNVPYEIIGLSKVVECSNDDI